MCLCFPVSDIRTNWLVGFGLVPDHRKLQWLSLFFSNRHTHTHTHCSHPFSAGPSVVMAPCVNNSQLVVLWWLMDVWFQSNWIMFCRNSTFLFAFPVPFEMYEPHSLENIACASPKPCFLAALEETAPVWKEIDWSKDSEQDYSCTMKWCYFKSLSSLQVKQTAKPRSSLFSVHKRKRNNMAIAQSWKIW